MCGMIYCSGCIGLNKDTAALVEGGVEAQTSQALNNLAAILDEAGSGLKYVVKTTVLLKEMSDFSTMNQVYAKFFTAAKGSEYPMPARTTFGVTALPMNALVEIDCVALLDDRSEPKLQKLSKDE